MVSTGGLVVVKERRANGLLNLSVDVMWHRERKVVYVLYFLMYIYLFYNVKYQFLL